MAIRKCDFHVFDSLSIVKVTGYTPVEEESGLGPVDRPGNANWLVSGYGFASDQGDEMVPPGILWTDYDGPDWEFTVLIATDEVEAFVNHATSEGYDHDSTKEVSEPMVYGDGQGTVTILKHPDGWVLAS